VKLLERLGRLFGSSSYENANASRRRSQVPGAAPTDAKKELSSHTRRELVRRSRYLNKNSGFAREMVADMAIYSTGDGIQPQAMTDDLEWNKAAEDTFSRWAKRAEITQRFSFEECQHLVCRGLDVDGEYFCLKVRDRFGRPRLQLIEAHRIGEGFASSETTDGIRLDAYGAPVAYRLILDDNTTRDIPAHAVMHIFEPESASGVRQPPTLQHSINHILDEMEMLALEKHAVKDNADIARILKRENGGLEEFSDFSVDTGSEDTPPPSDPVSLQRIVGGKIVSLQPGESLESFQSNRPSPVFTGFLEHLKRDSAAGMLPYEFVLDAGKIGGAGVRLIVAKADRRFSYRQMILIQRLLRPTWGYVIGDAIDRGELASAKNWNRVGWVCPRRVTVDAGREAQQNRADVETGLKTLSDHYSELGMDFREELERRAQDAKAIMEAAEKYGVPVSMLWKPSGTQMVAQPERPVDKASEE
jgi:lambda family phage portal protein